MAKKDWRAIVPEKFYKAVKHPRARTVGQLIELLKELPPTLPVRQSTFSKSVEVVVYNIGESDRHVAIEDP